MTQPRINITSYDVFSREAEAIGSNLCVYVSYVFFLVLNSRICLENRNLKIKLRNVFSIISFPEVTALFLNQNSLQIRIYSFHKEDLKSSLVISIIFNFLIS